jgi:hypothetical protein
LLSIFFSKCINIILEIFENSSELGKLSSSSAEELRQPIDLVLDSGKDLNRP